MKLAHGVLDAGNTMQYVIEDKAQRACSTGFCIQPRPAGGAKELVMDAELVAVDRSDGDRLRAFQELATRARGHTELHQVTLFHLRK